MFLSRCALIGLLTVSLGVAWAGPKTNYSAGQALLKLGEKVSGKDLMDAGDTVKADETATAANAAAD